MGKAEDELSILITDDEEIQDLNRRFRGIDHTTDVLSFPQGDGVPGTGSPGGCVLGDVVISMDRAEAQSVEFGVSVEEELSRLLIHGALHLMGFDHETGDEDADRMSKIEEKYVTGDS